MAKWPLVASVMMLLAFASIVVAGGCGSDSSASSSVSKKQFVERANRLCVDTEFEQLGKAQKYSSEHPKAEEADLIQPALVPTLKKELKELEALGTPDGDEEELEALYVALRKGIEGAESDPASVVKPQSNPFNEANKLATAYGIGDCGRNP
jgi:hypothetical protein